MHKWLLFVLAACLMVMQSCDEDDVCEECNDSIQHMYGKMQENACNPDFMENAYQRILDDCGVVTANYVTGYMAHNCAHDAANYRAPNCNDRDGEQWFATLNIDNVDIVVEMLSTSGLPDDEELVVRLDKNVEGGGALPQFSTIQKGQSLLFTYDDVENGVPILFSLLRVTEDEEIAYVETSRQLFYYRPGNWNITREIVIVYDPIADGYVANFNYW